MLIQKTKIKHAKNQPSKKENTTSMIKRQIMPIKKQEQTKKNFLLKTSNYFSDYLKRFAGGSFT